MQKQIKVVEVVSGQKGRIDLVHTELDGSTFKQGQNNKVGTLASKLDADSTATLRAAKAGDTLSIEITKEGNFWNLTKAAAGNSRAPTGQSNAPQQKKEPFDTVGVKVGAARNQAIAYLSATKGTKFTLEDVDVVAYEIVVRQQAQEDAIRSNENPFSAVKEPASVGSFDDTDEFFNA